MLDKQIFRTLSNQNIPYRRVHEAIDNIKLTYPRLTPRSCVVAIDTTYFGRTGITIFRDVTNKVILHWIFVNSENIQAHIEGVKYLSTQKIVMMGFVVDGFWGFYNAFGAKYDVQMCQKHMADLIRRKTTLHPRLEASRELKGLSDRLSSTSKQDFLLQYNIWLEKWKYFLAEQTYSRSEGRLIYTHERIRQAIRGIDRYLPYLFTFERNRWIPNTNNSLEGFNSGLKSAIELHRGLRSDRKAKLIHYYLGTKSDFNWDI